MPVPAHYHTDTKNWIRCPADEAAYEAGMFMDVERGEKVIEWIESNCCLYEGDAYAGKLIKLLPSWRDFFMRLFGWVRWSKMWNCWVRRFNRFGYWAAKKNGKSPCLAALNTYLLCGDGEMGQKVYLGAMNGDQARISQQHTVAMIRQSPNLADLCKINNTTLNIKHLPTNSQSIIITGDNQRGQKAKEGFNGVVLFDEMHVVAEAMWRRVSRAGISRRQPLIGSVSTSGDDKMCIGYEWQRRGRDAAEHKPGREDLNFLHIEHMVPEEVTDLEIVENPEKYLPMANPGWGIIIDPEEIIADCKQSYALGPKKFNEFLQYRANRWISSTNPWLDAVAWSKSYDVFDLECLRGRECYIGLDLARRLDMAGAAFLFPWPEGPPKGADLPENTDTAECLRLWPMAWLNAETVKLRDQVYPFARWGSEGYLNVTPGNTTDFARIKKNLRDVVSAFELKPLALYFDKLYAEEITQQLVDGEVDDAGNEIATGWGCERIAVPQTIVYLTSPSCELDRLIRKRLIRHPGNPVLDWQVDHVEAYVDVNQNVRPVKPEPHSAKSIDIVMASVMAMIGVMQGAESQPRVWKL